MKTKILLLVVASIVVSVFVAPGHARQGAIQLYQSARYKEDVEGKLEEAIAVYREIVEKYARNEPLAAKALLHIGLCYEKLGNREAQGAYQRLIQNYPAQEQEVALARRRLAALAEAQGGGTATKEDSKPRTTLVWGGAGMEASGRISRDGKYLSCIDWTTSDLAVRDAETGKVRRLTSKEGSPAGTYEAPDASIWSPDSRQIAYTWYSGDLNLCDLRLIALDGSKPRVLHHGDYQHWVHPCDWSPDGRYVLARFTPPGRLGLVAVKDGSIRFLKSVPGDVRGAARFSPDGRYVAYERAMASQSPNSDVFLMSLDSDAEVAVVEHPADDRLLEWSPDGSGILFSSNRAGTWDLWLVPIAEGKPRGPARLVRRGVGRIGPMGTTPNGDFYYSTAGFVIDVFSATLDPDTGRIVDSPQKLPLLFEGGNQNPDLSRDGSRLVYISRRGASVPGLYVYSFQSGNSRELHPTADVRYHYWPVWTPDGRFVLLLGRDQGNSLGLYKIDAETSETALAFRIQEGSNAEIGGWGLAAAPDGRSVYYLQQSEGFCRVVNRAFQGTPAKEIARFPLYARQDNNTLSLSPDGGRLAVLLREKESENALKLIDVATGASREIYRLSLGRWVVPIAWSPDGRYIYFSRLPDPNEVGKWELWRVPTTGGDAQNLGLTMNHFLRLCIHPDGKRIVFGSRTANEQAGAAVWVMKNFLSGPGGDRK